MQETGANQAPKKVSFVTYKRVNFYYQGVYSE